MDVYDYGGVKRCSIDNPLMDLIYKNPRMSIYHVTGYRYDSTKTAIFEGILEINADNLQNNPGSAELNSLQHENLLYKEDTRHPKSANPPANFRRLFPVPVWNFETSEEQGRRGATLLELKNRDWEYFLPIRAVRACTQNNISSLSLFNMVIDFLCILRTFEYHESVRVIDPDFLWIDTRKSQLMYLGSAIAYNNEDDGASEDDIMQRAVRIGYDFFSEWEVRRDCYGIYGRLFALLNEDLKSYNNGIRDICAELCERLVAEYGEDDAHDEDEGEDEDGGLEKEYESTKGIRSEPCTISSKDGAIVSRALYYSRSEKNP